MNYQLTNDQDNQTPTSLWASLRQMAGLVAPHRRRFAGAVSASLGGVALTLLGPLILAHVIDTFIANKDFAGVVRWSLILFACYIAAFILDYIQTSQLGAISQQILFKLRNDIFSKLQQLPLSFFNQNRSGDLISRINNDTDKLSSFFSESLGWMMGNTVLILGAGTFMLVLNPKLGGLALIPGILILASTKLSAGWLRRQNSRALQSTSQMSGEIQENLNNFKVIVAFNRQDYFQQKFAHYNQANYQANLKANIANTLLAPIYDMSANIAQVIVLVGGLLFIDRGELTVGFLIAYLVYVKAFYDPLREMANMWSNFQKALAAWDRITHLLSLNSDLETLEPPADQPASDSAPIIELANVSFHYPNGQQVLNDLSFSLKPGHTYALVGPTGGGKTTTASLIARLYDPSQGAVLLNGQDIRSYTDHQRAKTIGFILQDPFLFNGTIGQNLVYANPELQPYDPKTLHQKLKELKLDHLLERFSQGIDTPVSQTGDSLSLGQKQIIAFIRAVIRQPKLLILDEATANVDTVTEQVLQKILDSLPQSTTKIIIAHRLNTIAKADQIFFVNAGSITNAGSLQHAMDLLTNQP